jgi:hypothetical protein
MLHIKVDRWPEASLYTIDCMIAQQMWIGTVANQKLWKVLVNAEEVQVYAKQSKCRCSARTMQWQCNADAIVMQ